MLDLVTVNVTVRCKTLFPPFDCLLPRGEINTIGLYCFAFAYHYVSRIGTRVCNATRASFDATGLARDKNR